MLELHRSNTARSLGLALLFLAAGCAHGGSKAVPSDGTTAAKSAAHPAETAANHVTAGDENPKQRELGETGRGVRLPPGPDSDAPGGTPGAGRGAVAGGRYSEALPDLERATRASSQMVAVFRSMGDAYVATGDLQRAAMAYRQAVVISPDDPTTRLSLAHSLTEIGDFAAAREAS